MNTDIKVFGDNIATKITDDELSGEVFLFKNR